MKITSLECCVLNYCGYSKARATHFPKILCQFFLVSSLFLAHSLLQILKEKELFAGGCTTLWKLLKKIGFQYKKINDNYYVYEKPKITLQRSVGRLYGITIIYITIINRMINQTALFFELRLSLLMIITVINLLLLICYY